MRCGDGVESVAGAPCVATLLAAALGGSVSPGSQGITRTDQRVGAARLDFTSVAITP